MKNDSTSTARYVLFLALVFVAWIFLLKFMTKEDSSVRNLLGIKRQTLSMIKIDYQKDK